MKLCDCGCGRKISIAKRSRKKTGIIKGQPFRFVPGHHTKNSRWNGGEFLACNGYVFVACKEHPRAGTNGYVKRAILEAEKALGKFLPKGPVVHHHDRIRNNDEKNNLVICEDRKYHMLLHRRMKIYENRGKVPTIREKRSPMLPKKNVGIRTKRSNIEPKIRTNIHLTEQQRAALRELAKEYRRTPAEMVRRAIDYYYEICTGRKIKEQGK